MKKTKEYLDGHFDKENNLSFEKMKDQIESVRKRSELAFAKEAPEIQKQLKLIQTPLSFSDIVNIYRWLWRNQITIEMLSSEVLNDFKKTEQYKKFISSSEEE